MTKFDEWNSLKKKLHEKDVQNRFYINSGEIRYVHLWHNIGTEEDGKWDDFKRPVLVVKKLWNLYLAIPMTTHGKYHNIYYHRISDRYFYKPSFLILSQIKAMDKRRFIDKVGKLSVEDFIQLKQKIKTYYF